MVNRATIYCVCGRASGAMGTSGGPERGALSSRSGTTPPGAAGARIEERRTGAEWARV